MYNIEIWLLEDTDYPFRRTMKTWQEKKMKVCKMHTSFSQTTDKSLSFTFYLSHFQFSSPPKPHSFPLLTEDTPIRPALLTKGELMIGSSVPSLRLVIERSENSGCGCPSGFPGFCQRLRVFTPLLHVTDTALSSSGAGPFELFVVDLQCNQSLESPGR
jgi:hypothetical protein